jgi:flagellar hook-associated protein 1 FlgK
MRATRSGLDDQWREVQESLTALVTDVNSAAADIATLNQAIQRATQTGQTANELSDKRDVLVLKLAQQIGATVRPGEDGVLNVLVGGVTLVAGATAATLAVAGPTDPDSITASDQPRVVALPGGHTAGVGGTAAGQLSVLNRLIPENRKALDDVATALVTQVNALHRQGHGLDGVKDRDLLGPATGPITAANIAVLISDPRQLGVAALAPDATGPSADNGIANAFADLRLRADGADTVYRGKIVELGVQAAVSERNLDIQAVVTANVDGSRESVAGVNLDEEMANMLQFQHAYSAAARMVTAIDEALDTLINRTGVVGR